MARETNKQPVSFRFDPQLVKRLRQRAAEAGTPRGVLAERYVDEGMRMDAHPGIYFRDGGAGRRPVLLGTRLDVAQVVETLRQNENSIEATADYLDLTPAQVEVVAVKRDRPHLEQIADPTVLGAAAAEQHAVVTNNVRDYRQAHQ